MTFEQMRLASVEGTLEEDAGAAVSGSSCLHKDWDGEFGARGDAQLSPVLPNRNRH